MEGMKPHVNPRALETDEIPGIVDDYRRAAVNAQARRLRRGRGPLGNNYLLEQFVRDSTIQANDRYGGSIENRLRFPLEVGPCGDRGLGTAEAASASVVPATTQPARHRSIPRRMPPFGAYVDALNEFGLLYIHTIEGVTQQTVMCRTVRFPRPAAPVRGRLYRQQPEHPGSRREGTG